MPHTNQVPTKTRSAQKAALTRAINSKDPDQVVRTCREAVTQWKQAGFWPDDWNRWQIALDDTLGFTSSLQLEDL